MCLSYIISIEFVGGECTFSKYGIADSVVFSRKRNECFCNEIDRPID